MEELDDDTTELSWVRFNVRLNTVLIISYMIFSADWCKHPQTEHNYNQQQHKQPRQPHKETYINKVKQIKLKPGLEAFYAVWLANISGLLYSSLVRAFHYEYVNRYEHKTTQNLGLKILSCTEKI